MNEDIVKRKFFQEIKGLTLEQFWNRMNVIHSAAYEAAVKHMVEAMECTPGVYKPTINRVLDKAKEIREEWDDMKERAVEDDELEQIRNLARRKAK
jgi:chemotaxis regulatin CheY-phosphate phosphatase CheZ